MRRIVGWRFEDSQTRATAPEKHGRLHGGVGPAPNSVLPEGKRADERADALVSRIPAKLLSRHSVESCIRTLSDMARSRSIAIPSDLDNQVTSLFNKPALHLGASKASKLFRSSSLQSVHLSRESSQSQLSVRFDRTIVEGLQDIVVLLEAQLHPLFQAEFSVFVNVLYRPEYFFQPGTEARKKCDNGVFIRR
jgi:hypothetical protein